MMGVWTQPCPKRTSPQIAPMGGEEIERRAIEIATHHEEDRGWQVQTGESENRGFDLISRRPHPADPKRFVEVRFIAVKVRTGWASWG